MDTIYSARLADIIREFRLEILYAPEGYENIPIFADDVNRPGLQLAGFFDYFDSSRLQVLGKVENTFLDRFTPEKRLQIFERLFATNIPALIISRGMDPFDECMEMATVYGVPILRSIDPTSYLVSALISGLKVLLAPRITRHGVLVEVYGEEIGRAHV